MVPKRRRPCGTWATPFRTWTSGRALVTSWPPRLTVPEVARMSPLRTPSSVDFPAPLAPTSAISSAGATSRSIPNSTGPASYPAVSPRTLRSGSGRLEAFGIALAQIGLNYTLVAKHYLRLALGQDLTGVEDDRAAADSDDHTHHVLDQQDCHAGGMYRPDHLERLVDLDVVEPRHDLVQQQQLRPGRHRARDLEPLAIGDRERRDRLIGLGLEADQRQHIIRQREGLLDPSPRVRAPEQRSDPHVLTRGHRAERLDDLERAADPKPGDPVRRHAGDRRAVQLDVAAVEVINAADAVQQRRLAGAVGADDAHDVAFGDLEVHSVHRGHAAESLGDSAQLELGRRGGRTHRDVSRSERRRYARLSRVRPPKKSMTPRGTKITTATRSKPRMTCATMGRASDETNGMSNEIGRVPPRNWMSSCRRTAPAAGPNTVPVPPSSAIRIIWTLYSIGNTLSWLMKTFHWEKIPPARPVRAAASAKAATLYAVVLTPSTEAASSFSRIAIRP